MLVIEKEKMGGQITITSEVVNYPGVPETDGKRLTENMRQQAEFFGAEFMMAEVKELNPDGDIKKVVTDKGNFETLGIVLATGASPRKIGFEGEIKYQGRVLPIVPPVTENFLRDWTCCLGRRLCRGRRVCIPYKVRK